MVSEQRIRAFLFYLSVGIFLIGLPFILSFALGYKFDTRVFKFTKTGLIFLKTQPQGASIYLDGRLLNDKTPYTINELLPSKYNVRLELEDYYPWLGEVFVNAGKVTRVDKVILFPVRPNIKQLNKEKISSFFMDEKKGEIYYIDSDGGFIYRSDLEGQNFEEIGRIPDEFLAPMKWKISPDKEKLVCFNQKKAAVIDLVSPKAFSFEPPVILDYPHRRINDMFWHSDSYHLIVVTDRDIEVSEAKPLAEPVSLVNLNKRNILAFYDDNQDTLYFIDSQKAEDGRVYDNVYKLELSTKSFSFQDLMKPKAQ